jgi:hypothetical protein
MPSNLKEYSGLYIIFRENLLISNTHLPEGYIYLYQRYALTVNIVAGEFSMPIKKKSFLILLGALLISVAILFGTASSILIQGYSRLETLTAKQNVERVEKAIFAIEDQMKSTVIDWSYWDDTFDFISNQNQDYIDSNLQDNTLAYLKINFIQYLDANGRVVFTKAVKFSDNGPYPVDGSNMDFGQKFPLLIQSPEDNPQQWGFFYRIMNYY